MAAQLRRRLRGPETRHLGDQILKVNGFVNHQVDVGLMTACGGEIAALFNADAVTKVLTAEASGIVPAMAVAQALRVPLLYARESRPLTMGDASVLEATVEFPPGTVKPRRNRQVHLCVSSEFLGPGDCVVLVDDFLATGTTTLALQQLCARAGARVAGAAFLIEKVGEGGRAALEPLRVESLAQVALPGAAVVTVLAPPEAEAANARANDAYRRADFEAAVAGYSEALAVDESAKLFANRAQAHLKLREPAAAEDDCSRALRLEPGHAKALLRRAQARALRQRFAGALADLDALLATPELPQSLLAAALPLRRQVRADGQAFDAASASAVGKLVTDAQALRLFWRDLLPAAVCAGAQVEARCYVANEFGLWRRPEAFRVPLSVRTVNMNGSAGVSLCGPCVLDESGKATVVLQFSGSGSVSVELFGEGVMAVTSLPVRVGVGVGGPGVPQEPNEHGVVNLRTVRLGGELAVSVGEAPGELGIGGKVWDASLVLCRHLAASPELVRGRRVLELGSGTGLVGIAAALLGAARVELTDLPEVVALMGFNAEVNGVGGRCAARALPWGAGADVGGPWDVVLMSDVVYDPAGYAPLAETLAALAATPLILMAHRHRHPSDGDFFGVEALSFEDIAVGGGGDGGGGGECGDVRLLRVVAS